jgi:hypothetical protein
MQQRLLVAMLLVVAVHMKSLELVILAISLWENEKKLV